MADLAGLRTRVPAEVSAALGRAASLGFLGPAELTEQIDHALGFVLVVEADRPGGPGTALDLGAGGGLPGLVLATCWPNCRFTLLDSGDRRSAFLKQEVSRIPGLEQVRVARGRAEELGRREDLREQFEVVTARSFGAPAVTAECGSPFVVAGGVMVVSEPPDADEDRRWPDEGLARLGLVKSKMVRAAGRFGYQKLHKASETDGRYPRRAGVPAKRPLF
jgi:16S rRNA (guanine527-N7)-methyltransferase